MVGWARLLMGGREQGAWHAGIGQREKGCRERGEAWRAADTLSPTRLRVFGKLRAQ